MNRKVKWGIAGILVASVLFSSIYVYNIYKPEDIYLEGTVAHVYLWSDTADVIINTTDGEERIFNCHLIWGIVLLAYSNESQIYRFHLTKSKSDKYYHLYYEEVEQNV